MALQKQAGLAWIIDLGGAALFAWGIADGVAAAAAGHAVPSAALAAMLGGGLVRAATAWGVPVLAVRGAQATTAPLRRSLVERLLGSGAAPSSGQSAVLAIDHVATIEGYDTRFVPARVAAAAAPLVAVAIIACASLVAAGILLGTLIPFVFGMILAGTAAKRASERQLEALGDLSDLFVDRVRTLPILRHFGAEDRIARQVDVATREVAARTVAVLRVAFLSSAVLEFFSALAVALVAVYCGFSLLGLLPFPDPETLTLREAFFALAMAPEFYLPMRRLAAAYHDKQLGEAARTAIAAVPEVVAPAAAPEVFAGVEAKNLVIAWPGRTIGPVSVSLGTTGMVALTGPTGSGKTSLLAAIAGQIVPSAGSLRFRSPEEAPECLSHQSPSRVREGGIRASGDTNPIAWAAQHPLILPGTLRDNLALAAPHASDADLLAAIDRVGLGPMLARRGAGLDLPLDHRGSGLSGGERRRLGLARALLADRPLLLADEPTADLDAESAAAITALLRDVAKERAVIVATHDPRLIATADAEVTL
ncbi:ATP-binding cassette domain-containing protein [Sphingomonas sp. ABOLD]|uniref:ATP-binding cassette subfamily C protein CydD n=1 Tax=Sphingomonas trueperi TaxID=53317 RepID=A0A7X6BCV3_9SPHN|nr:MULTISPECIES: ATP-binding cassette domain-containing protein [Sphingomonas]NJB98479.1 ATP-binding cassette subfamily C protein CydD [Sphingomonas trueperi]RSV33874.1 ATP-binding cassette domain-containing protein [Sphingomonas sp. ABOLE]RSV39672.1 ATP-binding cassette domain-containing protein [Sphingomonas sp. ABOLD]